MLRPLLRRAAAPLALAATMTTVGAARAEAQARCVTDFLSSYLESVNPGFACRLGHFVFSNFALTTTILSSTNVTVNASDPADVVIQPVNAGFPGRGFIFADLVAGAPGIANQVDALTDALNVDGRVQTTFSFDFVGDGTRLLRNAGFGAILMVQKNAFPGQFDASSSIVGDVRDPGSACLDAVTRTRTHDGVSIPEPLHRCDPDRLLSGTASYTIESSILRTGTRAGRTIDGVAGTALGYVRFGAVRVAAVPEPATVALLGGGLLALGGVAARRRRA